VLSASALEFNGKDKELRACEVPVVDAAPVSPSGATGVAVATGATAVAAVSCTFGAPWRPGSGSSFTGSSFASLGVETAFGLAFTGADSVAASSA